MVLWEALFNTIHLVYRTMACIVDLWPLLTYCIGVLGLGCAPISRSDLCMLCWSWGGFKRIYRISVSYWPVFVYRVYIHIGMMNEERITGETTYSRCSFMQVPPLVPIVSTRFWILCMSVSLVSFWDMNGGATNHSAVPVWVVYDAKDYSPHWLLCLPWSRFFVLAIFFIAVGCPGEPLGLAYPLLT